MVIVNADDFGLSTQVNDAIKELFEKKIISSTTLMTNMSGAEEAVQIANDNGFADSVGLHFNLIEGEPLSEDIRSCGRLCTNGQLSYKRNSILFFHRDEKKAICKEFRAQLGKMRQLGLEPSHMDSHQHVHTELAIYLILRKVMKKEKIKAVRIGRNVGVRKLSIVYKYFLNALIRHDGFRTVDYFNPLNMLLPEKEKSSIVEYMCHPIREGDAIIDAFSDYVFNDNSRINNIKNYRAI